MAHLRLTGLADLDRDEERDGDHERQKGEVRQEGGEPAQRVVHRVVGDVPRPLGGLVLR